MARDHLSRNEIRKDALQSTVEATATAVGGVAMIVTGAVRDIARTVGGLATDVFEIRDAARKAQQDQLGVPAREEPGHDGAVLPPGAAREVAAGEPGSTAGVDAD